MDDIVGVRFIEAGPVSYCSPGGLALGIGDYVIVRGDRGERLGWVVIAPDQVLAGHTPAGPVRVVDRIATFEDIEAWEHSKQRAREDRERAQVLAARNDPRMRVASVVYDLAGKRGEVTFSAPERVEYRWLEQQLSDLFEADIRVSQVGDRDRAKAAGGVDVCGRALCCSTWMTEFPAISIRMAKDQDLPPNPSKISGVCGRLLCCLSFEVEAYRELRGDLPKVGKRVTTPVGRAKVLSVNSLKQIVRLRFDETGEIVEIGADELRAQYGSAVRPEELEAVVEEPIRRRDRMLQDSFLAPMTAVPTPMVAPRQVQSAESADIEPTEATETGGATAGAVGEDGEPRGRRRRGRRGGRGRIRADGGATEDSGEAGGEGGTLEGGEGE